MDKSRIDALRSHIPYQPFTDVIEEVVIQLIKWRQFDAARKVLFHLEPQRAKNILWMQVAVERVLGTKIALNPSESYQMIWGPMISTVRQQIRDAQFWAAYNFMEKISACPDLEEEDRTIEMGKFVDMFSVLPFLPMGYEVAEDVLNDLIESDLVDFNFTFAAFEAIALRLGFVPSEYYKTLANLLGRVTARKLLKQMYDKLREDS